MYPPPFVSTIMTISHLHIFLFFSFLLISLGTLTGALLSTFVFAIPELLIIVYGVMQAADPTSSMTKTSGGATRNSMSMLAVDMNASGTSVAKGAAV